MIRILILSALPFASSTASAWQPSTHQIVAEIVYEMLDPVEREKAIEILSNHPQFDQYFKAPHEISDQEAVARWQFTVAGQWCELIQGTKYDRPKWHYYPGPAVTIGITTPQAIPERRENATLASQELNLLDALRLCMEMLGDATRSESERAIALCWVLSLVADAHHPCYVGALYAPMFPGGTRGDRIPVDNGDSLREVWDRLLESDSSPDGTYRRVTGLGDLQRHMRQDLFSSKIGKRYFEPMTWLRESLAAGQSWVYTNEVRQAILAAIQTEADSIKPLHLSEEYLRNAEWVATDRVRRAGFRAYHVVANCIR
jgi:hypothetical protein